MSWQSGEGWESGWETGGGASSGGDSGGGWGGNDWLAGWAYTAPTPPGGVLLQEAFGKGYHKGWNEGHSAGFGTGYQSAAQSLYGDAMWGGKGKGPSGKREPEAEAAEPTGGKKKKKKGGSSWKEWNDKYSAIDPDKEHVTPYFYTRLGKKKIAYYPQEIQEELVKAQDEVEQQGVSKDIEYNMTGGWMYKLRIFGVSEKDKWEDKMSEVKAGDGQPDGQLVGAQWDMNKATAEPPEEFEKGVKYRPIFLSE